jgi:undecaprenyl-diphosphatase
MEQWNQTVFLLINGAASGHELGVLIARACAEYLIWLIPMGVGIGWLIGDGITRRIMIEATAATFFALLLAQLLGVLYPHPRPFMIGLGQQFVAHVADSSFPSDHATVMWTVACTMMLHDKTRFVGYNLALLGLPVAWARIYLGVHFPLDMIGAALLSVIASRLTLGVAPLFIEPLFALLMNIHRRLFAPFIRRGWVSG